jgi:Sap, sulfolipid-1-addressing protein
VAESIGAVLTFAIGVAISPVPIIAVILMLFSARARVNGPLFLLGWVVALGVVSGVAYALSDAGDVATDSTAAESVAWGKIVIGVLFLLLALRQWRSRPAPDAAPVMPKWMAGIDSFSPGKAFTIALLLAGVNPKNLLLSLSAGAALAQTGVSSTDALVSLIVYVIVGSITILAPVAYYLVGGDKARTALDSMKGWLAVHNAAVMIVLFLVFGVKLIADGLPALGG